MVKEKQIEYALKQIAKGAKRYQIARDLGISESTLYRLLHGRKRDTKAEYDKNQTRERMRRYRRKKNA